MIKCVKCMEPLAIHELHAHKCHEKKSFYETIKDSIPQVEKTVFASGAQRDIKTGKGRFDLIEPELLFRLAAHYESGAKHYGDRNWEKGIPVSDCINSAFRHFIKYMAGWKDEDHLAAVVWNITAIMRFEKDQRKDLMDLPWQKESK